MVDAAQVGVVRSSAVQTDSEHLSVLAHVLLQDSSRLEVAGDEEGGEDNRKDDVKGAGGLSGCFEVLDGVDLSVGLVVVSILLEQRHLLGVDGRLGALADLVVVILVVEVVLSGVERVFRLVCRVVPVVVRGGLVGDVVERQVVRGVGGVPVVVVRVVVRAVVGGPVVVVDGGVVGAVVLRCVVVRVVVVGCVGGIPVIEVRVVVRTVVLRPIVDRVVIV